MTFRMTEIAHDSSTITQKLLRAVLEFVALLATGLAPDTAESEVVVHDNLEFLCFVGLVQDCLDHAATFFEVFICLSCDKHIQWLFVPLLFVIDL